MSTSVLRTADAWYVLTEGGAARIATTATTTGELLADRRAVAAAAAPATDLVEDLALVSPVTAPCRVVAQMTNFASHVTDSGMDPQTVPLAFFRKTSGSIAGPADDVVKPAHVRLLDYEVEIGLVIGRAMPVGADITADSLPEYVAGLVVADDVSARDVQLSRTQFYEAKSYPGFTPVGPALVLLDAGEFARFPELRLTLSVNGEPRQNALVGGDMVYPPLEALRALTRFQRLDPGDLVLTGTPAGTALSAPPKAVEKIAGLLPTALKWRLFFKSQVKNPKYLADGDVIEARVATDDRKIDLGSQRTTVRYAR